MLERLTFTILVLFCLFVIGNSQSVSENSGQGVYKAESSDAALKDYFHKAAGLGFSGAVLVTKDGKILVRNGYGWADVKRRLPNTAETVFDIGSNTKVFTAVAVMQLEEKGKLSTSDSITKYFSNVPEDKKGVTIHHLLTHTSGFEHEEFYDESPPKIREILKDREKYIQRVMSFPLAFKPGEKWLYSNTGFSLLAAIVEKISGQSYEIYLRENIFKPAGMLNTGYVIPNWKNKRVARGYNDGDTDYGFPWDTQWSGKIIPWDLLANGGLLSTVDDMSKFIVAVQGEKLLSPKTKDKMLTVYVPERGQAYGWVVPKVEPGKPVYVTHGGDAAPQGWNADFRWYRDNNLTAIVLTNRRIRAGSIRRPAMNHLADVTLFNQPPKLPDFALIQAKRLSRLEGIYKLDSGASFRVKTELTATGSGKSKPVLVISGQGQQAIDLLFSANQLPGLSKASLELNEKTKAYIEALTKNDLAALKAFLPADSSAEEAVRRWKEFVRKNGEIKNIEILGTSPLNQTGVQTFVRLEFKNTRDFYHVTWRGENLHEQDEDRLQPSITVFLRKSFVEFPLNLAFLPKTEKDFATYDLFKGRTINISFPADDKLVVHTKEGAVTAQKVRSAK